MNATVARAEFLETRRSYLGGTDLAAITGLSSFGSPLTVYLDKLHPERRVDKDTLPMRRGLALERFVADEFVRSHPQLVCWHPQPIVTDVWGFPAGASLDFLVAHRDKPRTPIGIMDSKTAMSFYGRQQWKAPDPDRGYEEGDLPDAYYVQLQHYLAVVATKYPAVKQAWAAADTGDDSLTVVPVSPNEGVQERLIEDARDFWNNHILAGIPPEPNGSEKDYKALQRLFPETIPDPPVTIDDPDAPVLVSDYLAHKFKEREHKDAAEVAKQRLCAILGENERGQVDSWLLEWKPQSQRRIDSKKLQAEYPDVAEAVTKVIEFRKFNEPKEVGA